MMSDSNPYAPPKENPEALSGLPWVIDGPGILVRSGTVLPQVDLETGDTHADMKASVRRYYRISPLGLIPVLGIVVVLFLRADLVKGKGLLVMAGTFWVLSVIYQWLRGLRGMPSMNNLHLTEFISAQRRKRHQLRSSWLTMAVVVFFAGLIGPPLTLSPAMPNYVPVLLTIMGTVIVAGLGVVVWAIRGRDHAKSLPGPKGWLRIRPVHPDALAFLREREKEMMADFHSREAAPKRRVFTSYYHRYPLRALVGKTRKPLLVLNITMMKWLKSRHLEQVMYDVNEATETPLHELRDSLRAEAMGWLETHPDWSFIRGKTLSHPTLPQVAQDVTLASPDLSLTLWANQSWNGENPVPLGASFCFNSWIEGGILIRTWSEAQTPLPLRKVLDSHTPGNHEEVLQAHLARVAGKSLVIPADRDELLEWIQIVSMETERVMIEEGYRSPTREGD